jgi:hypothetical protein
MVKTFNLFILKSTRQCIAFSLVLFLCAFLGACRQDKAAGLTLIMAKQHAVALRIPVVMLQEGGNGSSEGIQVRLLARNNRAAVLGSYENDGNDLVFRPLVPFTAGLSYAVWQHDQKIGIITVPVNFKQVRPRLVAIYPNNDTLPENLLKLYFHFSQPMRTGQSLNYIKLINSRGDTLNNTFLNLQPELWDTTGTTLTLWLDPGRIKRDLQPNVKLGNPLKKGERYTLTISSQWKDAQGLTLAEPEEKHFTAGARDDEAPNIAQWRLSVPKANGKQPLIINTITSLDHYLLAESISIINSTGEVIKGKAWIDPNDEVYQFTPMQQWQGGTYTLQVNARLEDLAGNNLNKLFDRDITREAKRDEKVYERKFTIQ